MTEHNLIDKRQYGFRENHSTELAITNIYDELLRNFDHKLITCSLFLDLSKAFDCCDHEILLDKLYHYGIRGVSHNLFSNFLHNRMQCTKIGAFKSSYKRISCGVPQGSVISPLLFLIYINDITKASSFHTTPFADDVNLHMSNSCFNVLQTTANLELCKINHWPGPSPGFSSRGGQKPGEAINQKGGHIFKIQYWMYAATGGPNVK